MKEREWCKVKILSYQPKKSSVHKDWVNVQVLSEKEPKSLYWNDVESWISLDGYDALVLLSSKQEMSQEVIYAKFKELDNLKKNDVFEEVEFKGQQTVSSRLIVTEKDDEGKKKSKSSLSRKGI